MDRIAKEADRINMKLRLDSEALRALCKQGRTRGQEVHTIPACTISISMHI
jgi:hypothetical protein